MKNKDIIQLYEGICNLKDQDFGVSVGFIFVKNLITLEPYYRAIKEQQRKLWRKYGIVNENGDIIVEKNNIDVLNQENEELMNIETSVNIEKIDIGQLSQYKINLENLVKIYSMIKESP